MILKALFKFLFGRSETTDDVMGEFHKTLAKLRQVEQNHAHKAEQEEIVIEEAMRRRRAAAEEAAKASISADKFEKLLNPNYQNEEVANAGSVTVDIDGAIKGFTLVPQASAV